MVPAYGAAGACQAAASGGPVRAGHWLRVAAEGVAAASGPPAPGAVLGTSERLCAVGSVPWMAGSNSSSPTRREPPAAGSELGPVDLAAGSRRTPGPLVLVSSGLGMMPGSGQVGACATSAAAADAGAAGSVAVAGGRCGYTASTGCRAASWYTSGRVGGRAEPPSTATLGSASSQARSRTEKSVGVMSSGGEVNGGGAFNENFPNATARRPHLAENSFPAVVLKSNLRT